MTGLATLYGRELNMIDDTAAPSPHLSAIDGSTFQLSYDDGVNDIGDALRRFSSLMDYFLRTLSGYFITTVRLIPVTLLSSGAPFDSVVHWCFSQSSKPDTNDSGFIYPLFSSLFICIFFGY